MRKVLTAALGVTIACYFTNAQAVSAERASCDFAKCMSVCESDNSPEYSCAGMCGRIISLCTQIVLGSAGGTAGKDCCPERAGSFGTCGATPVPQAGGTCVGNTEGRASK